MQLRELMAGSTFMDLDLISDLAAAERHTEARRIAVLRIEHFEKRLEWTPDEPELLNDFAQTLLTIPVEELRDTKRGWSLADRAVRWLEAYVELSRLWRQMSSAWVCSAY
ncbi:MAG: hypothetical protein K9N55_12105 [Phycisphaerae bacterium]|nr:hypothetical protein [Phycisphaerae bacterium]